MEVSMQFKFQLKQLGKRTCLTVAIALVQQSVKRFLYESCIIALVSSESLFWNLSSV